MDSSRSTGSRSHANMDYAMFNPLFHFNNEFWAAKLGNLLEIIHQNQGFVVLEKKFEECPHYDPPQSMRDFTVKYDFGEDIVTFVPENEEAFIRIKLAIDRWHNAWSQFAPCTENDSDIVWPCYEED